MTTPQLFQILFQGELLPGFDRERVKLQVAQLLKASKSQADQLFSGKLVSIRKSLPAETAERYRATLTRHGMRVHVFSNDARENDLRRIQAAMAPRTFRITYAGEILQGFSRQFVMHAVAEKLQLDSARLTRLFSGKKAILKKGLGSEAAARYLAQAAKLGMLTGMELEMASQPAVQGFVTAVDHAMATEPSAAAANMPDWVDERFLNSVAKTQLYPAQARLYSAFIRNAPDETSTLVDIDIGRAYAEDAAQPENENWPITTSQIFRLRNARVFKAPKADSDVPTLPEKIAAAAPLESTASLMAQVPVSPSTADTTPQIATPVQPSLELPLAMRSIELHAAPQKIVPVGRRSMASRHFATITALIPRTIARIFN